MDQQPRSLGRAIRDRRIEIGLTQELLAERIGDGVRQSDISRLERDMIQLPRPNRLRAIAHALGVTPGELLARSGWEGIAEDHPVSSPESMERAPDRDSDATLPVDEAPALSTASNASVIERLRKAIARSHETQAHTAAILKRADVAANSWQDHYRAEPPKAERSRKESA